MKTVFSTGMSNKHTNVDGGKLGIAMMSNIINTTDELKKKFNYQVGEPSQCPDNVNTVFMGVAPLLSFNSPYVGACIKLFDECWNKGVNVVLYIDDWKINLMCSNFKSVLNETVPYNEAKMKVL